MTTLTFDKNIPEALKEADNMPSLPAIAIEVLRLTQDEDSTIDDLAECMSRDPALAAKILKLSNSAMFNMGQEITTLQRATMVLGVKTVKLMSLSFSLVSEVPSEGSEGGFSLMDYWKRSIVRSVASRSLASFTGSRLGDEAFLCGLLGHFGRLILSRVMTDEYEAICRQAGGWPSLALEEETLGFSNTDVCATLLKQWHIPEMIYMATGHGAHPESAPEDLSAETHELIGLLQLSAHVEELICSEEKGQALSSLRSKLEASNDKSAEDVDEFLMGLESSINETAEMFSIKLPDSKSHEDVMNEAKLQMVNVSLGTAIDLRAAHEERDQLATEKESLITKATTDSLTGLPNRSLFDEFMQKQISERTGKKKPLALGLVMIDVDHFKKFNDTYGHAAGDEVLRHIGKALAEVTRKGDLAARYGGEEFAVIAPQTNPFNIKIMATRLREAIEAIELHFEGHDLKVTASLGAACITSFTDPSEAEQLVKLADAYLYKAKKAGRNRVEVYKDFRFPEQ